MIGQSCLFSKPISQEQDPGDSNLHFFVIGIFLRRPTRPPSQDIDIKLSVEGGACGVVFPDPARLSRGGEDELHITIIFLRRPKGQGT